MDAVVEDKLVGPPPPYVIVLSTRGAMLRLHRTSGCYKAQHLAFASYEVCELDPVPPRALHALLPFVLAEVGAARIGPR